MMFQKAALRCLFVLTLAVPSVPAQDTVPAKTSAAEDQPLRVPKEKIPPAPPLSPADALKTFKLQPGFRIELVASEPMVEDPIVVQFDADGRMWVVEMRGYMPNVDGKGEEEPVGRVSVLEDVDGDGRMDKRTTFLDGLVMPRALAVVREGVLIAEPPHLWFCRDTNGDLKCDDKIEVANDYGSQRAPEHTANGLVLASDNWIYSLYHTNRYRFTDGKWIRDRMPNHAQWGLTQDDFGRLFYSYNSDILRGNLVPSHYIAKAGPAVRLNGVGAKIVSDQSVWPIRMNPGVNRGYLPNILREDGTLANVTAACGTCIYRGDNFPADCYGNAFVCEPAANVVKRNVMSEQDGVVTAKNAYDKAEFLASTDERFRPVNAYTGPDGALYIVDMYRGILQHRLYVTPYLRNQILDRGLDKPLHQGRIYRVVHEKGPLNRKPRLAKASSADLVKTLSHPNGWWRDTAQRLLVERNDAATVPALQQLATESPNALARLHALWTLEGMAKLDAPTVGRMLDDKDTKVRAAAVRVAEPLLRPPANAPETTALRSKILSLVHSDSADVQIQLALTLGEIAPDDASKAALTNLAQSKFALAKGAAKFNLGERETVRPPGRRTRVAPLSAEDQKRFEAGKASYEAICIACHQPHGLGQEGLAPPLVDSEWVSGSEQRLARIVLHGMRGPVTVKGQQYEMDMPALGVLEDEQVANILTYIRREWGHQFPPVSTETVKKIREENATREDSWTEAELLKIP